MGEFRRRTRFERYRAFNRTLEREKKRESGERAINKYLVPGTFEHIKYEHTLKSIVNVVPIARRGNSLVADLNTGTDSTPDPGMGS